MKRKRQLHLTSHTWRVLAYMAIFFWVGFVWGSIKALSLPETGSHLHLRAWGVLCAAIVTMLVTMDHWIRYVQLFFGGGIVGGLLTVILGHLPNGIDLPRLVAGAATSLLVMCSLFAYTIAERSLRFFDRVALITFVVALEWGLVVGSTASLLSGLAIGCGCLGTAWLQDKLQSVNGP